MKKNLLARLIVFFALCGAGYLLIPTIVGRGLDGLFPSSSDEAWLGALKFFMTEVPRIILLLALVVFVLRVVRSMVPVERAMRFVAGLPPLVANFAASAFGIITPFCSCGVVPLFIGLVQTGVPLGVSLSLLIAAPMINEIALALLVGLFGWKTALLYVGTGMFIATLAGFIIGKLGFERYIEEWIHTAGGGRLAGLDGKVRTQERVAVGLREARTTVANVWPFLVGGMAVGALIHGYVPGDLMAAIMGKGQWWSVPVAVLVGIPLYMNSAGVLPIVQSLLEKGAALGTSLAFMMSVIGLSMPEIIMLRRVLKMPLILTFIAIVGCGIVIVGYLFNAMY